MNDISILSQLKNMMAQQARIGAYSVTRATSVSLANPRISSSDTSVEYKQTNTGAIWCTAYAVDDDGDYVLDTNGKKTVKNPYYGGYCGKQGDGITTIIKPYNKIWDTNPTLRKIYQVVSERG